MTARASSVEPAFATVLSDLAEKRASIDAAVSSAGNRLMRCVGDMNRNSALFEALPREIRSVEMDQACRDISSIGDRAQEITSAFGRERETMDELWRALAASVSPIADLQRSVKMIGILSVNARVVAAELGQVEGFEVFTVDIDRLSREAGVTVSRFSDLFGRLRGDLRAVIEKRQTFETAHSATLTGLGDKLAMHLERVEDRRRSAADMGQRTGETVRQISARIGSVVLSLQSGDRMRQRIEHVEQALSAGHSAGMDPGHATGLPGRHVLAIAGLQADQLQAAVDEYDAEMASAEDALAGLARDALDMVRSAAALTGKSKGAQDGPIAALAKELHQAISLLRRCATERTHLDALAERMASAVAELLAHVEVVQNVEAEMRILSLNATVKCAQLGSRGRALNVVAQQLRDLTMETVASAEAAVEALRACAGVTARIRADASGDLAREIVGIEAAAQSAVERIAGIEQRTSEAVQTLETEGPDMARTLKEAAADIKAGRVCAAELADQANRLASPDDDHVPMEGDELVAALLETLDLLRKGYTMEDERRIHDAFTARVAEKRAGMDR
ncbi:hypothetical protein EJC49_16085 [Aquibium carbonis]|uniref:Methyl-accepting transducer domain-containing protein n=1 Tax=Aquibium carbonis TaxID=2495581 RepID=A0A429YVD1_9HYPH|nr:hypothetical protein [Aquibium carbonis]RST85400.1 hypothetical protein EJC49_16085 [Aquibium carbonis]